MRIRGLGLFIVGLMVLWSTSALAETLAIDACQDLAKSKDYVLTADVTATGSCFRMRDPGHVFDCAGHTITYATSEQGFAFYSESSAHLTIQNCVIVQGSERTDSPAIFWKASSRYYQLTGTTITTRGSNAVEFTDSNIEHFYMAGNTLVSETGEGSGLYVRIKYDTDDFQVLGNTFDGFAHAVDYRVSGNGESGVFSCNNFINGTDIAFFEHRDVREYQGRDIDGNYWGHEGFRPWGVADPDTNSNEVDASPAAGMVGLADGTTTCGLLITDVDDDGVPDDADNCVDVYNPDQLDLDSDGAGDVCDADADGDGYLGAVDDCDDLDPATNPNAIEDCSDGFDNDCDGYVDLDDAGADCDMDGVVNGDDVCPSDFDPGQVDTDVDGLGDVCDADDDGDGWEDVMDNCPLDANPAQADLDGDGIGDACDADSDGDGVVDTEDQCLFVVDYAVPSQRLGTNHWEDVDRDGRFDTTGKNASRRTYTMADTGGCTCAQIIETCGYGMGHVKFGCSNGVMDAWTALYDAAGMSPFQCSAK